MFPHDVYLQQHASIFTFEYLAVEVIVPTEPFAHLRMHSLHRYLGEKSFRGETGFAEIT